MVRDSNKLVVIDPNNTNNAYSFKNLGKINMNVLFKDRYGDSLYDTKNIDFVDEIQIYSPHFNDAPYDTIVFITMNETKKYSIYDTIKIKLKDKQIHSVETNGSNVTITTMSKGATKNEYNDE